MWTPIQLIFRKRKQETKIFKNRGKALRWFRMVFYQKEVTCHCCSVAKSYLFATSWTAARQASLSFTVSWSLLKLMSIESVMPSNHLILCCPLLVLPSIFPSIRVFSNELALHIRWPSIGASASASVLLMNIQGWFPLRLTVLISLQSTGLSRVFSTTVWKHQFFGAQPSFMVQLLPLYLTIGKTIALTIQTFVGEVMSLLLNTLSRFVIAFLPRSSIF